MGKIAFIFSGQGDQYSGMGKELYETFPVAREIFSICEKIRPNTLKQCFYGTEEELAVTRNTQPCLFAMELAASNVLYHHGIVPDVVAGFSLGEVTACTFSGLFDVETGFRLVCKRGELMQREAEKYDSFMAVVLKLNNHQVQEICIKHKGIYPVNYNCPGQITVSGSRTHLEKFKEDIKKAGGRTIPLKVNGAFHSPYMEQAAEDFLLELKNTDKQERKFQLYSNMTGTPYTQDVDGLLSRQINNPVLWEKTIRNMIFDGIDTFIEVGPGKTLTGMVKKIDKGVKAVTFMDYLKEAGIC